MRYGLIAAAAAATLSITAISAGAQVVRFTPATAAWCRVHRDRCVDSRDIRYERRDVRRDARDIALDRRDIRLDHRVIRHDVHDIRVDRAYHPVIRADQRSAVIGQRKADAEYRRIFGDRPRP
jgi:hypothetical protein